MVLCSKAIQMEGGGGGFMEAKGKSTGKNCFGARAVASSCEITSAFRVVWAGGSAFTQEDI